MQEMSDNHQDSADLSTTTDCLVDPAELIEVEPSSDSNQSHEQDLRRRKTQRRCDLGILLVCTLVVALSFVLRVRPDQRVEFRFWPDKPLPHSCMSRIVMGLDCPGCGLTRSFIFLAEGNIAASLGVHRLGWIGVLFVLLQLPYRVMAIKWPERIARRPVIPASIVLVFFILMIGNWLIGFFV
jgi:hypothetical protein